MAIPPELQYANEAEFVSQFIRPLLGRLGYSVIADYHGPGEFGKDIVFADFDKFGQVTYHAIQAKYVASISLDRSSGLVEQCKLAYGNPFKHPHSGQIHRINSFYVLNGGTFSEQARENFFQQLENPFGGSIRLIDGPALVMLDRYASISNVAEVRHRLFGMYLEHAHNQDIIEYLKNNLKPFLDEKNRQNWAIPVHRLRHVALDAYLAVPMLSDRLDTNNLLDHVRAISFVNESLPLMAVTINKKEIANSCLITVSKLEANITAFRPVVAELIRMLGPLSSAP